MNNQNIDFISIDEVIPIVQLQTTNSKKDKECISKHCYETEGECVPEIPPQIHAVVQNGRRNKGPTFRTVDHPHNLSIKVNDRLSIIITLKHMYIIFCYNRQNGLNE